MCQGPGQKAEMPALARTEMLSVFCTSVSLSLVAHVLALLTLHSGHRLTRYHTASWCKIRNFMLAEVVPDKSFYTYGNMIIFFSRSLVHRTGVRNAALLRTSFAYTSCCQWKLCFSYRTKVEYYCQRFDMHVRKYCICFHIALYITQKPHHTSLSLKCSYYNSIDAFYLSLSCCQ